jgi:hypothetical protein
VLQRQGGGQQQFFQMWDGSQFVDDPSGKPGWSPWGGAMTAGSGFSRRHLPAAGSWPSRPEKLARRSQPGPTSAQPYRASSRGNLSIDSRPFPPAELSAQSLVPVSPQQAQVSGRKRAGVQAVVAHALIADVTGYSACTSIHRGHTRKCALMPRKG